MFNLLLGANATVTVAHSRTADLPPFVPYGGYSGRRRRPAGDDQGRLGQARRLSSSMSASTEFRRARTRRGQNAPRRRCRLREAEKVASAITPVPGGVGKMTIAMLMASP
jgi:methylenetetrahydrofolate dehydrogenase (NADP+)/methenyltetrahydrofolate cyclohydrolase